MREKTNVYFLAEITRPLSCADCILLENIDSNGNIRHALIDTGINIIGAVCNFLAKHNVKKLEFLCLTHSHKDHTDSAVPVLEKYQVDKLIMKEFDIFWAKNGNQLMYEKVLAKAIEKGIKILGISFISLGSAEYSPSQSEDFKNNKIKNAKKENFEYFNENNTSFEFGSADIKIMNWEIYDTEGNIFITGQNNKDGKKVYRDVYEDDNQNSLGILLFQGDKKAFFSGDMNNTKKKVGGKEIGDEDRLKDKIGKIDLLKLGHHGYANSNTDDYMNVLSPNYAIITNNIGEAALQIIRFLDNQKINYLYSTHDEYEVCAVIYNDEITLGFGTSGIKKVKDEIFYIPKDKIYKDYLKCKCEVKYEYIEKSVNNWDELKTVIEQFKSGEGVYISDNCFIGEALKIYLNSENNNNIYNANSTITVNNLQNIHLVTNKEITLKRDKTLIDSPLFIIDLGLLTLGEENMRGKIIIDGNKANVASSSQLIIMKYGEFSMYDNVILCNNLHKISEQTLEPEIYGSAIWARATSKINIYGGEISNNTYEIFVDKNMDSSILPENMVSNYIFEVRGAAIYMKNSILNIYGGKISNNEGINNTEIYSNKNATINGAPYNSINQTCCGAAIYADVNSKVYLYKGEISNNIATNNAN